MRGLPRQRAGWSGREGGLVPGTPPSRRESKTKPESPPEHRSYVQRMLDVHSLHMLTFFSALTAEKISCGNPGFA